MNNWKKKKAIKRIMITKKNDQEKRHCHKLLKKIKIKMIDNPIEKAVEYYNYLNPKAQVKVTYSKAFLLRLTLNHLRHDYSNYEQLIQQFGSLLYNKYELKNQVNKIIVEKYNF